MPEFLGEKRLVTSDQSMRRRFLVSLPALLGIIAGGCQDGQLCRATDFSCSIPGFIAYYANLAPWIVFNSQLSGNEDIWKIRSDGTELTQLTTDPAADQQPELSPDGTFVAFSSTRSGNAEIWLMKADGSGPVQITNHAASDQHPTWSPDGLRLAFQSDRSGNLDIWLQTVASGATVQITIDANNDQRPCFAPQSERIFFGGLRSGNWDVYARNADGSGSDQRLTTPASIESRPCATPDETGILLNSDASGTEQVWQRSSDGALTQLTNHPTAAFAPSPSPRSAELAFTSSAGLFLRRVDGTERLLVSGVVSFPRFAR